jgi:hypothetical protein
MTEGIVDKWRGPRCWVDLPYGCFRTAGGVLGGGGWLLWREAVPRVEEAAPNRKSGSPTFTAVRTSYQTFFANFLFSLIPLYKTLPVDTL